MSEKKWTPGPWSIGGRGRHKAYIDGIGWYGLAKVIVRMRDSDKDCSDGLANANLIAAAPDLYDALDLVIQEIVGENYDDEEGICEAARRVLAKARGEQQ